MHKRPVQELEAKEWPTSMKIRQEHCEILVRLRLATLRYIVWVGFWN